MLQELIYAGVIKLLQQFLILTALQELTFAGAYSDLLIYRGKERVILKGDQQPVGLHEAQKPFKEQSFQLQDDDLVISFTDGFTDQLGGGRRRK